MNPTSRRIQQRSRFAECAEANISSAEWSPSIWSSTAPVAAWYGTKESPHCCATIEMSCGVTIVNLTLMSPIFAVSGAVVVSSAFSSAASVFSASSAVAVGWVLLLFTE